MSMLIEHKHEFNAMFDRTILRLRMKLSDNDLKDITKKIDGVMELMHHLKRFHQRSEGRKFQKEVLECVNELKSIRTKHALPELAGFIRG